MKLGAVDLGSNSLKYAVAEVTDDGIEILDEGERLVRIGEGLLPGGRLKVEAVERTTEALDEVRALFEEHGVQREAAVATAGLRGAVNAERVLTLAKVRGFDVQVIGGDREAALTFIGPSQKYGPDRVAVFDVGGRSTEIIVGTAGDIEAKVSLPLGGVLLTEKFVDSDPPTAEAVEAIRSHCAEVLADAPEVPPEVPLIGVAGTALALYGHAHDETFMRDVVANAEGRRLTVLEVTRSLETFTKVKMEQRCLGDVVPPRRADVIVAGATLVSQIMARYRRLFFTVSARGVRYGLLYEMSRATGPSLVQR